jgi:diaminopimelate epimerase
MARTLPFIKMHGLGNDFVVIDDLDHAKAPIEITPELAARICDRRFGIGADQILWLRPPHSSAGGAVSASAAVPGAQPEVRPDARMEILNSDGSTAEMCGNGIRAVGLYLCSERFRGQRRLAIETLAGLKIIEAQGGDEFRVDMGVPTVAARAEALALADRSVEFVEVNVGNPHAVIFVPNAREYPVETLGPEIERHSRFPKRTNVEFVEMQGQAQALVRVWERGAGITLACGTGACASGVAAIATGRAKSPVDIHLPGGRLRISWAPGQSVFMEGPATEVFRGEFRV